MGITIHYEGKAGKEKVIAILQHIEDFAELHEWLVASKTSRSIVVAPHPECEALMIKFNEACAFSGFVKTGFAPTKVHKQVVQLFYEIKPILKRLVIQDESGYWLEYMEEKSGRSVKELVEANFPAANECVVIKPELLHLPPWASELDRMFWLTNPQYVKPFMEAAAVRDRMGYDLLNGPYLLTAEDMKRSFADEGFLGIGDWENDMFYFINLATLWSWKRAAGMKPTKKKRDACTAFAWALARGCHGFGGGFLNQTHRRAHIALDRLEEKEGTASPVRSLQILYGLFDFVGLQS